MDRGAWQATVHSVIRGEHAHTHIVIQQGDLGHKCISQKGIPFLKVYKFNTYSRAKINIIIFLQQTVFVYIHIYI